MSAFYEYVAIGSIFLSNKSVRKSTIDQVTFSEKIKMLGWLTVSAKSGHWKGERKSFFVLYKGTG